MPSFKSRLGIAVCAAGATLFAHATWIAPVASPLEVGKSVNVQIGNGHAFPESESALSPQNLEVFAVAPSGGKVELKPIKSGSFLTASYAVREPGMHRFVFVQDRGVISRTPQGLKPGGRDQNPGATQSMKMYRAAVAYAGTAGANLGPQSPLGVTFEVAPQRTKDSVIVSVLLNSKPVAGAKIRAVLPGQKEQELGSTGSDGKFTYRVPSGLSGPFLLIAAHSQKAAAGEKYDNADYSTALHLTW
jgi:uncharacterized GH25 family protein